MENMENEIMNNEVMDEVVDTMVEEESFLSKYGKYGIAVAAGAGLALAAKPVYKKAKNWILKKRAARKAKKAEKEIDLDTMELDDIPEIGEKD